MSKVIKENNKEENIDEDQDQDQELDQEEAEEQSQEDNEEKNEEKDKDPSIANDDDEEQDGEKERLENTIAVNKSVSFVNDSEGQDSPVKRKPPKSGLKAGKVEHSSIPNPILSANKPPKPKLPKEYELFDFIFPGGKLSKLCKIKSQKKTEPKIPEILEAFKFKDPHPCLILAGARDSQRGKLLAGVARAAFRSDAVILDSGVATGIENYCLRRSKLFLTKIFLIFKR